MIKVVERKRLKFQDDYTYLNRNMMMIEHLNRIYDKLLGYFKTGRGLHQYPDMWKTYDVLSKYLNVDKEHLLITRGVEGAIKQVFETLVTKGDSVGILTPTFAMYKVYAEVYGVNVVEIKGEEPDYKISVEQIKEIVSNIKVLFLDNPKTHLPSYFTHEELDTIIKYCEKHKVIVFLDEVYVGFEVESYLPNLNNHNNLVISSGFSKIAFPSVKSGWLVTTKELKKQIETVRDSYELNYFACKSIEFIVDNQDYINDVKEKILMIKKRWYDELLDITISFGTITESHKFKLYDSKGYVLRLYSENKNLVRRVYDKLYSNKIVVSIVDDKNLVFSVIDDKKIKNKFFQCYTETGTDQKLCVEYYDNGQKQFEGTLKNGKKEGLWTWWYENGQKRQEGIYLNGKKEGHYSKWNQDGQVISVISYDKNGGFWEEPDPAGFYEESKMKNMKDGLFRKYWSNGNLRYEWEYKDGKRADGESKGWYESGQLKQVTNWKNGKENGLHTQYYENGVKHKEYTFTNGTQNGMKRNWYESGQIEEEVYLTRSKKNGKKINWHKNGQKKEESYFELDKKIGKSTYWNVDGDIIDE